MQYLTCCVEANGADITAMVERARGVSYETALRKIGRDELARIFPAYDWDGRRSSRHYLPMKRDWHVSYHRSVYRGQPVYYVRHSAIEYIFG